MDQEAIQKQIMEIIQEMTDLEQERGQGNKEIKKKKKNWLQSELEEKNMFLSGMLNWG